MYTENRTERFISESRAIADNTARKRLSTLFDNGEYTELDRFAKNGSNPCEAVTAYGFVNGVTVYAFSQDFSVCSGAMGAAQAAKLERLYTLAEKNGCPVVGIYDSAGGHIDEGVAAMSAYGKLIESAARLSGVIPQISVLAGPCTGSAALLAGMADLTVASTGSGEELSENYAIAAENDIAAVKTAALLLSYFPQNNLAAPMLSQYSPGSGSYDTSENTVRAIADAASAMALYTTEKSCVKVYMARIGGVPVGIVAACPEDKNICACGAMKAARFVRMCDAFSLPVVTLLDAESFSDSKSAAALTHAYAEATSPKVTVIVGSAVGAAYIAMAGRAANADSIFAWDGSIISSLKPCTAVQLLYKDRLDAGEGRAALEKEYALTVGSPFEAAAAGCIDDVIAPEDTAVCVQKALDVLVGKRVSTLDKKHSNIPL